MLPALWPGFLKRRAVTVGPALTLVSVAAIEESMLAYVRTYLNADLTLYSHHGSAPSVNN